MTIGAIIAWLVAVSAVAHRGVVDLALTKVQETQFMVTIGSHYGIAAWACWAATAISSSPLRWTCRLVALLAIAALASRTSVFNDAFMRYIIYMGGLMLSQPMLHLAFRMPDWTAAIGDVPQAARPSRIQFGIGDVMITTAGVALLITLAMRYQPGAVEPEIFWAVLIGVWVLFPGIMALGCFTVLLRVKRDQRWSTLIYKWIAPWVGASLLIVFCSAVMSAFEAVLDGEGVSGYDAFLYACVVTSGFGTLSFLTWMGRLDQETANRRVAAAEQSESS